MIRIRCRRDVILMKKWAKTYFDEVRASEEKPDVQFVKQKWKKK